MHRLSPHDLCLRDYSEAVAKAIAWLGDRYLLARPINGAWAPRVGSRLSDESICVEENAPKRNASRDEIT